MLNAKEHKPFLLKLSAILLVIITLAFVLGLDFLHNHDGLADNDNCVVLRISNLYESALALAFLVVLHLVFLTLVCLNLLNEKPSPAQDHNHSRAPLAFLFS